MVLGGVPFCRARHILSELNARNYFTRKLESETDFYQYHPLFDESLRFMKDFFEKENDEVAEPQARHLSDIRNYLEHKYLRITKDIPATRPPDDLAMTVSREEFEAKALHLLGLARSALI